MSPMKAEKPSTLDVIRRFNDDPNTIVEAGELIDMRFPAGSTMSLRGGKLFHLLIKAAGDRVADAVVHRIPLAALNGSFHCTLHELEKIIDELHTTTLKLKLTDMKGRSYTKSGPLLSDVEREDDEEEQAEIRFEFSATLRKAISNSTHWGIVSRRAILAFESGYSLRLYSFLSLRAGLRKTSERFSIAELREILGVSPGKLADWKDLKRRAIEPALAEISHLAGFQAGYIPEKIGRKVVAVTLTWGRKDRQGIEDTLRELDRPRAGRKERRKGLVEKQSAREDLLREQLAMDLEDVIQRR